MPLVDLPLEKLLEYPGRNPRPADFDDYWQRAIAELDTCDPSPRFEPVNAPFPSAIAQDVWFNGVGGAKIHAKFMRPRWTDQPVPCIVFFHGYHWKSPDWFTLAAWSAAGYAVLAPDVRGQGGLSTDPLSVDGNTVSGHIVRGLTDHPDKLFYRGAFLDTVQSARVAASIEGIDPSRIFAHGASQGGGLTVACAALAPDLIRACVPVYPFLSDYLRVWEMDLAKDAYNEIKQFFKIQDPLHKRKDEVFEKLGYIDVQHLASRINCPSLWAVGLMDAICPPSTQFAAYNKVMAPKETLIYPDYGHDGLPELSEHMIRFFNSI